MPFSIANHEGKVRLRLEGSVTIRDAQVLARLLAEAPAVGAPTVVDTQYLSDVDTGILQLLCALRRTAPSLAFETPSDAFTDAVVRCGLRRDLLGMLEVL